MATKIYYPPTTLIGTANVGETKTLSTAGKFTDSNIKIIDDYEYYDGSTGNLITSTELTNLGITWVVMS